MSIYHYPSSTYNQALCGQWSQFTELKISKVSPTCKKCLKKLPKRRKKIMGNTYEISIWKKTDDNDSYAYESVWRGESRKEALKVMDKYAKQGVACIKLEYRP